MDNTIPASMFVEHRQQLQRLLPAHSLAILNANDVLPTNSDGVLRLMPNSDLFYLSGILDTLMGRFKED